MGADIHGFIDYSDYSDEKSWVDNFATLHLGRNYELFQILAGVRGGRGDTICDPKGLPERVSHVVRHEAYLYISENYTENDDHSCSKEMAETYTRNGSSQWVGDNKYITHPDWHSHSWLTTSEVAEALKEYKRVTNYGNLELKAVLASMRALEADGVTCKFIFWFDN